MELDSGGKNLLLDPSAEHLSLTFLATAVVLYDIWRHLLFQPRHQGYHYQRCSH